MLAKEMANSLCYLVSALAPLLFVPCLTRESITVATMHLSLQIQPRVDETQLYSVVDAVIADIKATGLPHIVGPMETTIEGEMDELLAIIKQAHLRCIDAGATRVGATIKTDFKPAGISFEEKLHQYPAGATIDNA